MVKKKEEKSSRRIKEEDIVVESKRKRISTKKKEINNSLDKLLVILQGKDIYKIFTYPVDTKVIVDYLTVIKTPMDFSTMKKKIDCNEYQSLKDFQADFELMCSNAKTYNSPDTIYYREADKLYEFGKKIIKREYENLITINDDEEEDGEIDIESNEDLKKKKLKSEGKKASVLYRRTADGGFLFSSLPKSYLPDRSIDPDSIDIQELIVKEENLNIWGTQNLSKLLLVNATASREKDVLFTTHRQMVPLNPFTSFFPTYNSSQSPFSKEESNLLSSYCDKDANLLKFIDEIDDNAFVENHVRNIIDTLSGKKEAGISDQIPSSDPRSAPVNSNELPESEVTVESTSFVSFEQSDDENTLETRHDKSVNDILEDNALMISQIQQLQNERTIKNVNEVTPLEVSLALKLKKRLAQLAHKVQPNDLIANASNIMKSKENIIPSKEPIYKGTLSASKPYAYASNASTPYSVPITASMVPTHFNRSPAHSNANK